MAPAPGGAKAADQSSAFPIRGSDVVIVPIGGATQTDLEGAGTGVGMAQAQADRGLMGADGGWPTPLQPAPTSTPAQAARVGIGGGGRVSGESDIDVGGLFRMTQAALKARGFRVGDKAEKAAMAAVLSVVRQRTIPDNG